MQNKWQKNQTMPISKAPALARDVALKLPVIDGPCKGQRMARPGEQFTFEVSSSISKTKVSP